MTSHSAAHHPISRLRPTFRVTLMALAIGFSGTARADDATPAPDAPHTSWAASVRAALAHKTHSVATWTQNGVASWYGRHFHGRRTSSGAKFDTNSLTAAHPSLPLGTKLLVTSQDTGRSVIVTINDRGPFNSRIIDLSHAAAEKIGMLGRGTAHVTLARLPAAASDDTQTMEVAEADPADTNEQALSAIAPKRNPGHHASVRHHVAQTHHRH